MSVLTSVTHGVVSTVGFGVPDPGRSAEFFAAVLGWTYELDPDGLRTAISPPLRLIGDRSQRGVVLTYCVDDLAAAASMVRSLGGTAGDVLGGEVRCADDQRVRFTLSAAPPLTGSNRHGSVAYFTIGVPDLDRAEAFYQALLGWTYTPVVDDVGRTIVGVSPGGALWRSAIPGAVLTFCVDDLPAAVTAVRAGGGTAGRFEAREYGVASDNCTDSRGVRFHLLQFA